MSAEFCCDWVGILQLSLAWLLPSLLSEGIPKVLWANQLKTSAVFEHDCYGNMDARRSDGFLYGSVALLLCFQIQCLGTRDDQNR